MVIASVPVPSSGATKSIAPITSFTAISVSPAARVRVGNLSSPVAACFNVRPLSASCVSVISESSPNRICAPSAKYKSENCFVVEPRYAPS